MVALPPDHTGLKQSLTRSGADRNYIIFSNPGVWDKLKVYGGNLGHGCPKLTAVGGSAMKISPLAADKLGQSHPALCPAIASGDTVFT